MDTKSFLTAYVTEKLPDFNPEESEGAPDIPYFTVDQQYIPLGKQPAMA